MTFDGCLDRVYDFLVTDHENHQILRDLPVISLYHMPPRQPPRIVRPVSKKLPELLGGGDAPQVYWGSWCDLRVPEKTVFGRTLNVGFDWFSRYPGLHNLAAVRLVCGRWSAAAGRVTGTAHGRLASAGRRWSWPPEGWPWLATAGCGLPVGGSRGL